MSKLHEFRLNLWHFFQAWRLEFCMAGLLAGLFFLAVKIGHANPHIAWIAFIIYVALVAFNQWTKVEKDREIRVLHADVERNIQKLKGMLGRSHDMHRLLIRQKENIARATEQLERSRQGLLAMSDLKNKFIASLSHELRTPVAAIQECISLIADGIAGPVHPKQKEFLEIARRNSERLTALLDNLLDLSKLEAGGMRMVLARVPMEEIALEVINTAMPKAQKKGITLSMDSKWNLPAALVDRARVVQVLNNLLDNAVKFTPASGKVTVSARHLADTGHLEISVKDTGCGLSKQRAERLLGGFYELGGKEDFTSSGAGIGLALCKEIVTQLGGSIWVESELGRGSQFCFTVPCYTDDSLLEICFRNALREAALRNTSLLHLGIQMQDYESLCRRHGRRKIEDALKEAHGIVQSCFRLDDRLAVDGSLGRIHVLIVFSGFDMRERMRKLDENLHGKTFFAGNESLSLQFLFGLARCPQDGEELEVLKNKINAQILSGGMSVMDLPLDGVA